MKTRHLCAPCPTPSSTRHRPQTHLHFLRSLGLQVTALIYDHTLSVTVLLNLPPLTGYEPNRIKSNPIECNRIVANRIVDEYENVHFTEDDQITELEDRVKFLSYHQSITASTYVKTVYNLVDNDAKYPDAEIDDEHTRNSLDSPLYLQERGASAERSQVYHSERENLMSNSSQDPTQARESTSRH